MRQEYFHIPTANHEEYELWKGYISRKRFLQTLLAGGIALQIPLLNRCVVDHPDFDGKCILTHLEVESVYVLQNTLFPEDGNGPSAATVEAHTYFVWLLTDEHMPSSTRNFWLDGLQKVMQKARQDHNKTIPELSTAQLHQLIDQSIQESWGERWFSRLLTIIFEATFLDPIYNVNPQQKGWQWVEHAPGIPRPSQALKYPNLLSQ